MNFQVENLSSLPVLFDRSRQPEIEALVTENIRLAREDWDSSEESWDFTVHPLVRYGVKRLDEAFRLYREECEHRIAAVQRNEEHLNRIFAEIYGLADELDCRAPETTLRRFDERQAAEDLVSFAAGCLFGRYTLSGIPVLEENYLPLALFPEYLSEFLRTVFGAEHFTENLRFLEEMLGSELSRYCCEGFYAAHCRKFRKRPLYWLASSGRMRAVYGLCYFHRMGKSPVPMLAKRTGKLPPCAEAIAYWKRLAALEHVRIDPDAGIPANHERFRSVFAAIR